MTTKLNSKQTSITTVRKHLRTEASVLTPLIFHCSLPLMRYLSENNLHSELSNSLGLFSAYLRGTLRDP